MGFWGTIVQTIVPMIPFTLLWNTVSQHVGYITHLNHNVDTLMSQTSELKRKREDYEKDVKAAELIGKKRRRRVGDWFNEVDRIVPETESIKAETEQGRTNFFLQYKLGKRIAEKMKAVKKLNDQGFFHEVAEVPHQSAMEKMQVPGQVEQQHTSHQTLEEIEQALFDDEIGVVGVVGMGGVGKTTLMKQIFNKFTKTQSFTVTWVTVSKDLQFQAIQQGIGKWLGLQFSENENMEERKKKLYDRLGKVRFMLILDDLWEAFSLEEAGIPHPDKQNGCKIVITTRSIQVSNEMESDKQIRVRTLPRPEAWDLFCSKTGDAVLLPGIQPIAEEVVDECGGVPLAIAVVGRAMCGKDRKELWHNALRALKRGTAPSHVPGMEQQVFRPLKFSYDYLEQRKIQFCFLYCCLFPEDREINVCELVNYWICEGVIDKVDSLEETLNEGLAIVEKLKDACLLDISIRGDGYVKMHDLLRDLAIWITTSESSSSRPCIQASSRFLVNSNSEVLLDEKNWEGCVRISLMRNGVRELDIIPSCPELVFLVLRDSWNLRAIESSFFQFMPKLQILNLSHTRIRSLPPSLSNLVNLRALILTCCEDLVELPQLGELKELQILDLQATGIEELPEVIWKLVKLKQLDLSLTKVLDRIPCNSISLLTSLEHLRLRGYDRTHDVSVSTWRQLPALKRLAFLDVQVVNLDGLTAHDFLLLQSFSKCKRICVYLGMEPFSTSGLFADMASENELWIGGFHHLWQGLKGIEKLMSHFGRLVFEKCNNLACASQIIGHSRTLKILQMYNCVGVRCIIDWREVADVNALDCLKHLLLVGLPKLESIFEGGPPLPSTRFQWLQRVSIVGCPKLQCIFSSSMLSHLHHLEYLRADRCEEVEEIVQGDILPDKALQRLREVRLRFLPKMRSISIQLPVLKSLERIEVDACPKLKKLPPLCTVIQGVKGKIRGGIEWWKGIEWEDSHSKSIYSVIYKEVVEEQQ